ncbi:hypothetical protein AMK59_7271, partial [Oryctes borbonicus]
MVNIHEYFSDDQRRESFKKRYLLFYNSIQTLGWGFILYRVLNYYISRPQESLYDIVKCPLITFQCLAFLEYYHAKYKLTKSNPLVTFQQIYSRIMVVCAVLMAVENSRLSLGFPMIMFAWSITEIIRYMTYSFGIYGQAPFSLTWLRYTTFIPLYPLGVTGELLCMYAAIEDLKVSKQWSMELPNKYNVVFYYHHYLIFSMLLYIPYFPKLYLHMFSQRRKVLGLNTSAKEK